ncbi:RHS domain-containing protein, partial [Pectobacterium parmentieri]
MGIPVIKPGSDGRYLPGWSPLEMTDAESAVRWSGDYGSFGAVNGQT